MAHYFAILRFYPQQANPQRPTGRGVWRVEYATSAPFASYAEAGTFVVEEFGGKRSLLVWGRRPVKPRSRVNPRHLLGV